MIYTRDMSTTHTATPAKLRTGSWGARVPGTAREGQAITVRARSGKTWDATVSRVLWTGRDSRSGRTISLCATESAPAARSTYHAVRGRDYCGYPCPVSGRRCTASDPCHDCQ